MSLTRHYPSPEQEQDLCTPYMWVHYALQFRLQLVVFDIWKCYSLHTEKKHEFRAGCPNPFRMSEEYQSTVHMLLLQTRNSDYRLVLKRPRLAYCGLSLFRLRDYGSAPPH